MDTVKETIHIIKSVLNVDIQLNRESRLLNELPEFDSQAVVTLLIALEEHLGVSIDDDEVSAEIFESVGTIVDFLEAKM